jgi:hypothetical protein
MVAISGNPHPEISMRLKETIGISHTRMLEVQHHLVVDQDPKLHKNLLLSLLGVPLNPLVLRNRHLNTTSTEKGIISFVITKSWNYVVTKTQ